MVRWRSAMVGMALLAGHIPAVVAAQTAAATPAPAPAAAEAEPQPVMPVEVRELPEQERIAAMRRGGLIILMRHERTEVPSRSDDYSRPMTECTSQRNLSIAGYAGAQESGVTFRAMSVPVGQVLASAMCRTMDTGRMMFGRVTAEPRLLHHDNVDTRPVMVAGQELVDLLRELPPSSDNHVLISHIGNIYFAIGVRLTEGEFVLLQRQEDGSFISLGKVDPGVLGAYARYAQAQAATAAAGATDTP